MAAKNKGKKHRPGRKATSKNASKQHYGQESLAESFVMKSNRRTHQVQVPFASQVLAAAKYILPLIGLMAGLMTVLCSLTASGVAVPGLTAIPDSTKLLVSDFLDSGVISFSLTAVLTLHFGFLILKNWSSSCYLVKQAFGAGAQFTKVGYALLGMTVEQGMLITLAVARLIVSDAGLSWVTLGQLLDAFNVWMPEISLGEIVACCLVLNAVASTSGQVLNFLWLRYVARDSSPSSANPTTFGVATHLSQAHHAKAVGTNTTHPGTSATPRKRSSNTSPLQTLKSTSTNSIKGVNIAISRGSSDSSDQIGALMLTTSSALQRRALSSEKQTLPTNDTAKSKKVVIDVRSGSLDSLPEGNNVHNTASIAKSSDHSSTRTAVNGVHSTSVPVQSSIISSGDAVEPKMPNASNSTTQTRNIGSSSLHLDSIISQGHNDAQPAANATAATAQTDTTDPSSKKKKRRSKKSKRSTAALTQATINETSTASPLTQTNQTADDINSGYECVVKGLLFGAMTASASASRIAACMTKMFKLVPDWMVEFAADNKENASAAKGLAEFQKLLTSKMTLEQLKEACSPSLQLANMVLFLKNLLAAELRRMQRVHSLASTCAFREDKLMAKDILCMAPSPGMPKSLYEPAVWQLGELCKIVDVHFSCTTVQTQQTLGHRSHSNDMSAITVTLEFDGNTYTLVQ